MCGKGWHHSCLNSRNSQTPFSCKRAGCFFGDTDGYFLNPSFELDDNNDGIPDGWSVNLSRFIAGQTFTIAGTTYTAPIDPTYPTDNATRSLGDDDTASMSYTSSLNTVTKTDGGKSLKLDSSGSSVGYGVVRGPWIYSSEFSVTGGQDLTFDWQALGGVTRSTCLAFC